MSKTAGIVAFVIAAVVATPSLAATQMMGMSKSKSSMMTMKKKKMMMRKPSRMGTMSGSGNPSHGNGGNGPGGRY